MLGDALLGGIWGCRLLLISYSVAEIYIVCAQTSMKRLGNLNINLFLSLPPVFQLELLLLRTLVPLGTNASANVSIWRRQSDMKSMGDQADCVKYLSTSFHATSSS